MSIGFWDKLTHVLKPLSGVTNLFNRTKAGLVPQAPSGNGTTKYLREDGEWEVPPDNNTGDSKANTTTFTSSDTTDANATSWTSVTPLASGETHASIFAKMSKMFKNIRYLRNAVTYDHANIVVIPIANINGYVAPRKGKLLVSLPNRNTDDSHYFAVYVNNSTFWDYAVWVAPKSRTNFSIDLEKNDVITFAGQSLSLFNIGAGDNPFQFLPTKTI